MHAPSVEGLCGMVPRRNCVNCLNHFKHACYCITATVHGVDHWQLLAACRILHAALVVASSKSVIYRAAALSIASDFVRLSAARSVRRSTEGLAHASLCITLAGVLPPSVNTRAQLKTRRRCYAVLCYAML